MESKGMIPLEEYRVMLGSFANKLSEEQILKLRRQEFEVAKAVFNLWLSGKLKSNIEDADLRTKS
jgi:hypothetical protein